MNNTKHNFDVYTHIARLDDAERLCICLGLGKGLSRDALRHIELEAKDAVLECLTPLRKTIGEIVAKDQVNKANNPDEDICEACQ